MKKGILSTIAIGLICTIIGCGCPNKVTQTVEHIQKDTIYLNSTQYDSIYIFRDHSTDFHPTSLVGEERIGTDTFFIKDVSVEYRYKMLRDTILKVRRDSIPYEVTVIKTREITRPLTWFDKAGRACFFMVIAIVIFIVTRPLTRKYLLL